MDPAGRIATDRESTREQNNGSGREDRAEQQIRQRKGVGVAPRKEAGFPCGIPAIKVSPPPL